MTSVLLPIGFAIFVWWFSTGIVLLLDGLPRNTFRWSHVISTLLALAAFVGLAHTAPQTSVSGAFCAFTSALLLWGWHELSFLTGWVTGPRKLPASRGAAGWQRFTQAVQAILWHELAILASGLLVVAITWDQPNQVGTGTFAVLWFMRISAKLNIFLGVRNLSLQLLPPHLRYLGSYFRRRSMNLLFPFVVTGATAMAVLLYRHVSQQPADSAAAVGGLLVLTLLVLAILEHWLLVLPLEATALWRWALRRHPSTPTDRTPADGAALEPDEELLHAR